MRSIKLRESELRHNVEDAYRRYIELNPKRQVTMYASFIAFTIIVFWGFGGRISLAQLAEAREEKARLEVIKTATKAKIEAFDTLEQDLGAIRTYLPDLNNAMPVTPRPEAYLSKFVREVGKLGYIVRNFRVEGTNEDTTRLAVSIKGNLKDIGKLVTVIESLKRQTEIESMRVLYDEGEAEIKATLLIYHVERGTE